MSSAVLAAELECACALARRAGAAALHHYDGAFAVEHKPGGKGPVTAADREANEIIVRGLRDAFPRDGILAEESAETHAPEGRADKTRLWCIDPIDGTREFVDHTGQFVVMVGLAIGGRARLGVVFDPLRDVMWRGVLAEGSDGNHLAELVRAGEVFSLRPSGRRDFTEARVVVSRHGAGRAVQHLCARLGMRHLLPVGSVGLKVGHLACGDAEIYVCASDQVHEWDTCGPEAILRAAGGRMTDLFGAPLRYNKEVTHTPRGMLATNGPMHAPLIAAIEQLAPQAPGLRRMRTLDPA